MVFKKIVVYNTHIITLENWIWMSSVHFCPGISYFLVVTPKMQMPVRNPLQRDYKWRCGFLICKSSLYAIYLINMAVTAVIFLRKTMGRLPKAIIGKILGRSTLTAITLVWQLWKLWKNKVMKQIQCPLGMPFM